MFVKKFNRGLIFFLVTFPNFVTNRDSLKLNFEVINGDFDRSITESNSMIESNSHALIISNWEAFGLSASEEKRSYGL